VGCLNVSSFPWQNFVPLGVAVSLERGRRRGLPPLKDIILTLSALLVWKQLQTGTHMLLIITSADDRLLDLSTSIILNDCEPPKKGFLVNFFCNFWMQRTFQHWIVATCLEIDQDNLYMKFSALNVDFSNPSPNPLGSRRSVQAGVKDGYPLLKSGYFTAVIS